MMKSCHCPACGKMFHGYFVRLCDWCARHVPADIVDGMRWDRWLHMWRMIGFLPDRYSSEASESRKRAAFNC